MVNYNGHDLHFHEWSATDDCIYYLPLATLVDNGYAKASSEGCMVPFENIYLLDSDERMLLGVPDAYDKAMRLRGEGMLNTTEFKYKLEFLTFVPDGDLFPYERGGNILICDNNQYLLSEEQYELLLRVEDYNKQDEETKNRDRCELISHLSRFDIFRLQFELFQKKITPVKKRA